MSNKTPLEQTRRCAICHDSYVGWGNNSWPVTNGRCCNECNLFVVVPARLRMLRETHYETKGEKQ
jgi:hypothetical protein